MMQITIVTYLRARETISLNFKKVIDAFQRDNLLKGVIVFSDVTRNDISSGWSLYVDNGRTKYARLKQLISQNWGDYLLSIDNDMELDFLKAKHFCEEFISSDSAIGWGLVGVSNRGSLADIIAVDKILSHNYIRPILWKFHWGISVPGQFFIFRCNDYIGKILPEDTFLDDLQIGLITNCAKFKVFHPKILIGREAAKETISTLLQQRKRWANGYASIVRTAFHLSLQHFSLVVVHGFFYHCFFSCLLGFLILLFICHPIIACICYVSLIFILSGGKIGLLKGACIYSVCFPIIHLYWGWHVISNLCSKK